MENSTAHNNSPKIKEPEKLLGYLDFFKSMKEEDYIRYDADHNFEYTPWFYQFIQQLFESNMVEDYEQLVDNITVEGADEQQRCEAFSNWMKELNKTLSRPCEMRNTDINFLRKAFLTVIRMEKIFPGSWGIDVETGTWLKLLKRFKELYDAGEIETE
ncbi:MAG: DUF6508 domain-containing protein [Bacteroidota bacterium]